MLNPDSLQVFLVAAETENFSLAAQRLHLSQPAVSQHIQGLEQRLGVALFDRSGRRIKLSATGAALLPFAQEVMRAHKQLEEAALACVGEVIGHLTIASSATSARYVLPRLLAHYREQYPLVRATVLVRPQAQVVDGLATGEIDLGVLYERTPRNGLRYHRFFQDELVLVAPAGHPWGERASIEPHELYAERFIMREPTSGTYATLRENLGAVGVEVDRLERVLTVENSEAILMAVEEGIGLGFVPCIAARRCLAMGRIQRVQVRGVMMTRWLYLAQNVSRPQGPALNAFWRFMEEADVEGLLAAPAPICHTWQATPEPHATASAPVIAYNLTLHASDR